MEADHHNRRNRVMTTGLGDGDGAMAARRRFRRAVSRFVLGSMLFAAGVAVTVIWIETYPQAMFHAVGTGRDSFVSSTSWQGWWTVEYRRNVPDVLPVDGMLARQSQRVVTIVSLPHSVLASAAFAIPLYWLVRLRSSHAWPRGCCAKCGYDLRASPIRCPECGSDVPQATNSIDPTQGSPAMGKAARRRDSALRSE